jgi:dienelactone hydrolase
VKIPVRPRGPKPVVLRPLVEDERLLERGIGVVTYSVSWEQMAPEAKQRAKDARPAESETKTEAKSVGRWLLAASRPGLVGRDYFALIGGEASWAIPRVVDYLATLPDVDPARVAIGGSSTTGFVALEALRAEPRLAAAVVRVACGDYHAFLRDSSLALNGDARWLEDGRVVLDADYEKTLQEREPIRFPETFPPRPLLMLNGARDQAIPQACARETARVLGDAYARAGAAERFRFVLFPERGHDLGPEADPLILAWWERWLLEP